MIIRLRLVDALFKEIHADLARPHPFAAERVGFLTCGISELTEPGILLLGKAWHAVADSDYIQDPRVGACIGGGAFRKLFQTIYREPAVILHVHHHNHLGQPNFSLTDERSMREFVPGFFNVCPSYPHGALVLSRDSAVGAVWIKANGPRYALKTVNVVGRTCTKWALT